MSKRGEFLYFALNEVLMDGAVEVGKGGLPGYTRVPSRTELDEYFTGCGSTFPSFDPRVHWCGIFAAYLLKLIGVRCHWAMGRGIVDDSGGEDLEIVRGAEAKTGLLEGDILIREPNHHHIIALEDVTSGRISCIEGNAGGIGSPLVAMRWAGNMAYNTTSHVTVRYRILS
jgi:hypothetical protein